MSLTLIIFCQKKEKNACGVSYNDRYWLSSSIVYTETNPSWFLEKLISFILRLYKGLPVGRRGCEDVCEKKDTEWMRLWELKRKEEEKKQEEEE